MKLWKKKEKLFVKTNAFKEAVDILDDRNWVVIIGNPGDGKSTIAHKLLLDHKKKSFTPIVVTSPHDWKKLVVGKGEHVEKQIVLIDDMFGISNINDTQVNEWLQILKLMIDVVTERNCSLKVVCTSRKSVYNQVVNKLEKYKVFGKLWIVDLSVSQHSLSFDEKLKILETYFKHYGIFENCAELYAHIIASIDFNYGFPHCVEIFCTNSLIRNQGIDFFRYPIKFVQNEIEDYHKSEPKKLCALLLVLLADKNEVCLEKLDSESDVLSTCLKLSGLSSNNTIYTLYDAFISLKDVYLIHDGDVYTFKHDSFREIIAIHFAKYFPSHAIKMLDLDLLINRTKLTKSGETHIQLVVDLPISSSEHLVKRLTNEMMMGHGSSVFMHDCWQDPTFQDNWFQYVATKRTSKGTLLSQCLEQKIVFNIGPLAYLALIKLERLLLTILSNTKLYATADRLLPEAQASDALVCSTFRCLSSNILGLLLDLGADVNGKLRNIPTELYLSLFPDEWPPCGVTSLVIATYSGSFDNVRVLLQHGASIYETGYRHMNIFTLAVEKNACKVLQTLLSHLAQRGNYLIEKENDYTRLNVLQHFIEIEYESFFIAPLKRIGTNDDIGKVISSYAGGKLDACLPSEFKFNIGLNRFGLPNGHFRAFLRANDANVQQRRIHLNERCQSSLHVILSECHQLLKPGSCTVLLSQVKSMDCNELDKDGNIPLFLALKSSRDIDYQFIDALLQSSDVKCRNREGRNCFHFLAASQRHEKCDGYMMKLKQEGADINERDLEGRPPVVFCATVETLEMFHKYDARLDLKDNNGADIIMLMIKENTQDIIAKISFLLENDVDTNGSDSENKSVLHYLVYSTYNFETQKAVVELLTKYGCRACEDDGIMKSVISHLLQNPTCSHNFFKLFASFNEGMVKSEIDHFFLTISDSPMPSHEKVECLRIMAEFGPIECGKDRFDALFCFVNVSCKSIEKIFGCLTICMSDVNDLICLTLIRNISDSIKYSILKSLMSGPRCDAVKFELNLDQEERLQLLSSPRCLNFLRRRGLCMKSLSVTDIPFEAIISRPKLLQAFKFHVAQLLDLKSIFGIKYLSFLVNKIAKSVSLKVLSAILKRNEGLDFTVSDEGGNSLLHHVLGRRGRVDTSIIDRICSPGTEINQKNHGGETPLFIACNVKRPYISVISCLIKNGGNVGYISSKGLTPLHLLMGKIGRRFISDVNQVRSFYSDHVVKMVDELNTMDNYGRTPLMCLLLNSRPDKSLVAELLYLLENSGPFDKLDIDGKGLLHYIAESNLPDGKKASLFSVLLKHGLSDVTRDWSGRYAIDMTLFSKTPSLKLSRQASDRVPRERIVQCLFNNIKFVNSRAKVEMLLEQLRKTSCGLNWQDIAGVTFISLACRHSKKDLVDGLLRRGSDPNIPDLLGHTAIFYVLFTEKAIDQCFWFCDLFGLRKQEELIFHTENVFPWFVFTSSLYRQLEKSFRRQNYVEFSHHNVIIAEINKLLEILQLLLHYGADPNQLDIYGKTPLHYCAEAPLLDTFICAFMEILISQGADVNAEDFEGRTPIMLCAAYGRTKHRRMNILIKANADLSCKDYSGKDTHDYTKQSFFKTWKVFKVSEWNDE